MYILKVRKTKEENRLNKKKKIKIKNTLCDKIKIVSNNLIEQDNINYKNIL